MPRISRIAAVASLCLGLGLAGCTSVHTHQPDAATAPQSWSLDSHGTMPFLDRETAPTATHESDSQPVVRDPANDLPF